MKLKPTIIEENVFKQEDIAMINDYVREHGKKVPRIHEWEGPTQGKLISESYFWDWHNTPMIQEKLIPGLNSDIINPAIIEHSYILDSYYPYEIHCDSGWLDLKGGGTFEPWYLVIIPVTPGTSKTICFEQHDEHALHFINYKENNEPLKEYIDDAYFKQNLSHCWDHDQPYLTFEKEFVWNEGSVMYCDMTRYHESNNYKSDGIDKKTCITLMTKKKIG